MFLEPLDLKDQRVLSEHQVGKELQELQGRGVTLVPMVLQVNQVLRAW